jgi:putative hydrolase of the HAD superfamily
VRSAPQRQRALLVDLDGVIRHWDRQGDPEIERETGLPPGAIRQAAFSDDLLLPAITGRVADEEWRRHIVAHLAEQYPDADAAEAITRWSAPPGEIDDAVLALLGHCRARATIVLVTNASSRLDRDLASLGIAGAFDRIVNSSVVGHPKPKPEIFAAALAAAGPPSVPACAAFFVDDKAEFVTAAEALGIAGHRYRDLAALEETLTARGLL